MAAQGRGCGGFEEIVITVNTPQIWGVMLLLINGTLFFSRIAC